ncbi:serine/threonine-protein kinase [Spirillospora sp. NPDC048911]|uniref:serine/threonine-protein kinase n=1 Tax=Spirillospora sp. NPDC048911 TaxID=3364527 RepID=UPI0037173CCD
MAPGLLAGRYDLSAPLGRGGMGQVWEGADRQLGNRRVAVKLLTNDLITARTDPEELVQRFAREAAFTARLQHPGVPAVYDAGAYGGGLYLVMELIEGHTVGDLIAEEGPLPVPWVAAIMAQVCSVLTLAHGRGLVHRDLKPQNLMVTGDGSAKVLDFGVATVLDAAGVPRITKTGDTVGTPAYMAPEQLRGERVTPLSDLYAIGCVLYEMLAGRPVFEATSPHALSYKHMQEAPAPIDRPDVPPQLEWLVRRLLAKEPHERPSDAREVYERLLGHIGPATPIGGIVLSPATLSGQHLYAQALVRLAVPAARQRQTAPAPPYRARTTAMDPATPDHDVPGATRHGLQDSWRHGASNAGRNNIPDADLGIPLTKSHSFGWLVLHSLWVVPTFSLGFTSWISFAYVGIRHRHWRWLGYGGLYAFLLAFTITMMEVTNDNSLWFAVPLLLLTFGAPLHATLTIPARLKVRAREAALRAASAPAWTPNRPPAGPPVSPPPHAAGPVPAASPPRPTAPAPPW